MDNRTQMVIPVPNLTNDVTHIKLSVHYSKGGINMFTYKTEERGFYVSLRPVARAVEDTFTVERFMLFGGGFKVLAKAATRDNRKTTEKLAAKVREYAADIVERYLQGNTERAEELMRATGKGL